MDPNLFYILAQKPLTPDGGVDGFMGLHPLLEFECG